MKKNVILVLVLVCVSIGLFGQYVYNLNSFEPEIIDGRAEALGRSSILSSTGANNVFNNPALLSELEFKDFQFSLRTHFGKTNKIHTAVDTTSNVVNSSDTDYNRTFHSKINGLSYGMPYQMPEKSDWKVGFAAGYRTYYDWGYNVHQKRKEEWADEITIEEEDKEYNGGFNTLVFGGGFNFKKKIFGGISISLPFLSEYSNAYEDIHGDEATDEGWLKGTFFTLSGSYILNDIITLGARLRTEYKFEVNGESSPYISKQTIPAEYGLALEIKPRSNLKLYTEYITRNLANYEYLFYYNTESEDGYSFRTGLEYGTDKLFRGGFFMQSVPVYTISSYYDEVLEDFVFDVDNKPKTETGFTVGFGTQIKSKIQLNFFGVYSFLSYDESYNFVADTDISNEVSYSLIKIGCSLGYSF